MFKNLLFILFLMCIIFELTPISVLADDGENRSSASTKWESLTPAEKEKARRNFQVWKSMDPEKKQLLREKLRRFKARSPEERAERIQRREKIREQRKNHPGRGGRQPLRRRK